jgi:hypothetical protein
MEGLEVLIGHSLQKTLRRFVHLRKLGTQYACATRLRKA